MKRAQSLVAAGLMTAALLCSVSAAHPQTRCQYFPETGHYVCGEFLDFFETRGGLEIFGHPLTEAFDDPRLSREVQYFQRARMEWHPHNTEPYQIQLGLLIDDLGYRFPPVLPEQIPASNSALHYYFPETEHVVSYEFLNYFHEKGGLDIFGYPRSEFLYEDGYIVQYFQRARMEWHPETPSGPQMRLTNLGEIYIERFGVPEETFKAQPIISVGDSQATPEPTITQLNVSASVKYAVTGRHGVQTVFVYVDDQRNEPVQGATISMTVRYQQEEHHFENELEFTNASGFMRYRFDIVPSPPGQKVLIDVTARYGDDLEATTQTFFLLWW
jgi:hypothetical protein